MKMSISGSSHNIILKPHLRCSISTFMTSYDHAGIIMYLPPISTTGTTPSKMKWHSWQVKRFLGMSITNPILSWCAFGSMVSPMTGGENPPPGDRFQWFWWSCSSLASENEYRNDSIFLDENRPQTNVCWGWSSPTEVSKDVKVGCLYFLNWTVTWTSNMSMTWFEPDFQPLGTFQHVTADASVFLAMENVSNAKYRRCR